MSSKITSSSQPTTKMEEMNEDSMGVGRSEYSWICAIDNFSKTRRESALCMYGWPSAKIGIYHFEVRVHPPREGGSLSSSEEDDENGLEEVFISLYTFGPENSHIKYTISILGYEKDAKKEISANFLIQSEGQYHLSPFHGVSLKFLEKDILPYTNDRLVIQVKILDLDFSEISDQMYRVKQYANFVNNQQFSDTKIILNDKTIIHAHRMILMTNEEFKKIFKKDGGNNIIRIEDVDSKVMLELIRFIYIGKTEGTKKIAKRLLIAAYKFDILPLMIRCQKCLVQELTVNNVLNYIHLSERYSASLLNDKAIKYFVDNKKDVIKIPEYEASLTKIGTRSLATMVTRLIVS
ncbi:hypothetical protein QAD02_015589 [Eretmocerus hayati]|uniref:Uncharacterized protein n=1 Tax=Eretmocerus hayati TaxID=131215 RepID=A0ACC2P8P3_9HYME|nr:hypothetical protein QAD02_015589 [Eretmocerus hayati]